MPSFDIVSKIDFQEVDNALNMAKKEIMNRYDFKDSKTTIDLDRKEKKIKITTEDKMKMNAIIEAIRLRSSKRGIDLRSLQFKGIEEAGGNMVRQTIEVKEGVDTDTARNIVKMIKNTKMKVQAEIQDQQVRVSGKKIDDLQSVIQLLKSSNLEVALQYVNLKG